MKKQSILWLPFLLSTGLSLGIAGCASSIPDADFDHAATAPSQKYQAPEFTGMLRVIDPQQCQEADGCGPQFSLLGRNLKSRVALEGNILSNHNNLIVSVTGNRMPLPAELVGQPGYENIRILVSVSHYRVRSEIPYLPFLADTASDYTTNTFGCDLRWDQSYAWGIKKDAPPSLTVRMTDTQDIQSATTQPWIQLSYNGNSGELIATTGVNQANPCEKEEENNQVITTGIGQGEYPSATSSVIWFVRVGAFAKPENVDSVFTRLTNNGFNVRKTSIIMHQRNATLIWLGPYAEQQTAEEVSLHMRALIGEKGFVTKGLIGNTQYDE